MWLSCQVSSRSFSFLFFVLSRCFRCFSLRSYYSFLWDSVGLSVDKSCQCILLPPQNYTFVCTDFSYIYACSPESSKCTGYLTAYEPRTLTVAPSPSNPWLVDLSCSLTFYGDGLVRGQRSVTHPSCTECRMSPVILPNNTHTLTFVCVCAHVSVSVCICPWGVRLYLYYYVYLIYRTCFFFLMCVSACYMCMCTRTFLFACWVDLYKVM